MFWSREAPAFLVAAIVSSFCGVAAAFAVLSLGGIQGFIRVIETKWQVPYYTTTFLLLLWTALAALAFFAREVFRSSSGLHRWIGLQILGTVLALVMGLVAYSVAFLSVEGWGTFSP